MKQLLSWMFLGAVFSVGLFLWTSTAKMEQASCIVGGYITRAIIDPNLCPGKPTGKILLTAHYNSTIDKKQAQYEIATCNIDKNGPCPITNEVSVCYGTVDMKTGMPFDLTCSMTIDEFSVSYISVSIHTDSSIIPIENYPTITLEQRPQIANYMFYLPIVSGVKNDRP